MVYRWLPVLSLPIAQAKKNYHYIRLVVTYLRFWQQELFYCNSGEMLLERTAGELRPMSSATKTRLFNVSYFTPPKLAQSTWQDADEEKFVQVISQNGLPFNSSPDVLEYLMKVLVISVRIDLELHATAPSPKMDARCKVLKLFSGTYRPHKTELTVAMKLRCGCVQISENLRL